MLTRQSPAGQPFSDVLLAATGQGRSFGHADPTIDHIGVERLTVTFSLRLGARIDGVEGRANGIEAPSWKEPRHSGQVSGQVNAAAAVDEYPAR
jgi:hypothetical protein